MAVLKMQRINICGLKKNRKAILERLQSLGTLEPDMDWEEDDLLHKMDTAGARATFEKHTNLTERAVEILEKYEPVKASMFAGLAGKPLIDKRDYDKIVKMQDTYITIANRIMEREKEIAEQRAEVLKLENQMEALTPWLPLDIPMNYRGTRQTIVLLGTLPEEVSMAGVYAMLAEKAPEVEAVDVELVSSGRDYTYLAVVCLKAQAGEVEEALRSFGFAKPAHFTKEKPADVKVRIEQHIKEILIRIQNLEVDIRGMAREREHLKILSDYYRMRAEKYQLLGTLPQTHNTFLISGYVPEKDAQKVADDLVAHFGAMVELEDIKVEEEAPVLLENNKFSGSSEGVLAAFGLPGKGEIDPTTVMSFFYVFLFGLMLSDAAYGLIVMIACGLMLYKFPRMGNSMRKSIKLFFWCGVSTLFWGIMFGGYFGDAIDVFATTFLGMELAEGQSLIPPVWFDPLNDPTRMLIYSMLFGVIHLLTGLGMKGYMCIRDKKYMDFLCDVVLWYLLLLGLLIMLLPSSMFRSISNMEIVFPAAVNLLGKVFAIVGAAGILLMSGRSSKSFGKRIALGAYDLYNLTGWLSDVLSYSRLLALGLATGVIASVFNKMGSMAGGGIVGLILFVLIFLIGHTFGIAINLLGAYVHTCRLQYVEFFGKFYEGGGREFNPFKENTKYVDIKEENYL